PVTLIAMNGSCADTITKNIVNKNIIAPLITRSNDTLSVPSGYTSYQWYLDNVLISGAIDSFHVATGPGDYSVMVTDSSGCSIQVHFLIVSVDQNEHRVFAIY